MSQIFPLPPTHPEQPSPPFSLSAIILAKDSISQTCENSCDRDIKASRIQTYHWSDLENRKYYQFLAKLKKKGLLLATRGKIQKINAQMSRQVRTRTPVQCRSHNQKMLKRLGSYNAIIAYFASYFTRKAPEMTLTLSKARPDQLKQQSSEAPQKQQVRQRAELLWPITKWDIEYSLCSVHREVDGYV